MHVAYTSGWSLARLLDRRTVMTTPAEFSQLIRKRRTIKPKQMDDREIPRNVLGEMFEDANWAPTHGLTEPWRFTVFVGSARAKLGVFLSDTYKQVMPEGEFKQAKFDSFRVNPTLAGAVVVIGMKRQESGKIPEIEEVEAVACAVQNLHLSATAYGLGGFWSSNVAATSDEMREFVGLAAGDRTLGLFYLGYPNCDWPAGSRQPSPDKVTWVDA